MPELRLEGCRPTPLAAYLKGLGVFRLVAEQADANARAYWDEGTFVLNSSLHRDRLVEFLLHGYHPTPILAPWNGGSGFYPRDNKSGIEPIMTSGAHRFDELRAALFSVQDILTEENLNSKPEKHDKVRLLQRLRNELPEDAVQWLDAVMMLTEDQPKYPPLLGTGGNDGRLDFTNNFLQRLVELFDPESGDPETSAESQLLDSLFGVAIPGLGSAAVGQFSPGAAGGPNSTIGYEGGAYVNKWDFVLMLEGAVMLAGAATRRLESTSSAALSYPFTVRATGSGAGNVALGDEGQARAEIWLPLWARAATYTEVDYLFSEGRVTLGRRLPIDGLDFVRAVSKLGTERGIVSFQRYSFVMRSGKAYLATPLSRIAVHRNPTGDIIEELEQHQWLNRFRRLGRGNDAPARLKRLVRGLEDSLFGLAQRGTPQNVQQVLNYLGKAQTYFATSPKQRDNCGPVPRLSEEWVVRADDGTAEFAIARAFAGLHTNVGEKTKSTDPMLMGPHFAPLENHAQRWDDEASQRVVWGQGTLLDNLHAVLMHRLLDAERTEAPDKPLAGYAVAPLNAVAAFLAETVDDARIARLLAGLVLVRIPFLPHDHDPRAHVLPAAYRILKPLFSANEQLHRMNLLAGDQQLPLSRTLVRRIWQSRNLAGPLQLAARRLWIAGAGIEWRNLQGHGIDNKRLLGALMLPVADGALGTLVRGLQSNGDRQIEDRVGH